MSAYTCRKQSGILSKCTGMCTHRRLDKSVLTRKCTSINTEHLQHSREQVMLIGAASNNYDNNNGDGHNYTDNYNNKDNNNDVY